MDEAWKKLVDKDMKSCMESRVRLEEHDKDQAKDIDEAKVERMELYEHKNKIYQKITILEAQKKFFPWLVMGVSFILSIASFVYVISKIAGG